MGFKFVVEVAFTGSFRTVMGRTARLSCGAALLYHTLATVGMRYLASPKERIAMADEILTVAEVAVLLKVAEKTVYTMAQKSELPCFKVRGQWRFRRADLDAWIDAKTRRAAGEEESK